MRIVCILLLFSFASLTTSAQHTSEEKIIKKVFFDFLQFYKKNVRAFNSFQLYKGTGKEQNPPYRIQWSEAERYFKYLRTKVPYVGEAYIKSERNDFKFYDSCYKADPDEEIVVGFDFDRWAGGQDDPEYLVKWHTDPKNIYQVTITGNTAILRIGSPLWDGAAEIDRNWETVPFIKEKGKWKMAGNITPEFDEESPEVPAAAQSEVIEIKGRD